MVIKTLQIDVCFVYVDCRNNIYNMIAKKNIVKVKFNLIFIIQRSIKILVYIGEIQSNILKNTQKCGKMIIYKLMKWERNLDVGIV